MAAASAIVSRNGNDQFRGIFSDTWAVSCVLDSASVATGGAATDTVAVPGVVLGDIVLGMSAELTEAGLVRRAYVSAANVVTIATVNNTGGAVDLGSTNIRLVIARML